jgi:hypothetical protein
MRKEYISNGKDRQGLSLLFMVSLVNNHKPHPVDLISVANPPSASLIGDQSIRRQMHHASLELSLLDSFLQLSNFKRRRLQYAVPF